MLIKLDENLGERGKKLFADAGHGVATVADQGLSGAGDHRVIEVCASEDAALLRSTSTFRTRLYSRQSNTPGSPCCDPAA